MKKLPDTQENAVMNEILAGSCRNPHEFLGMHQVSGGVMVRVYDPEAESVTVISGNKRYPATKENEQGVFTCFFARRKNLFAYQVEKNILTARLLRPIRTVSCPRSARWIFICSIRANISASTM